MTTEQRLDKLEELHAQGGVCEGHRSELWKALTALRERLARLETKLLVAGGILSVGGPIVASFVVEWWHKK